MKVAIIGLGYVGYPLFLLIKSKNIDCIGLDISQKQIEKRLAELAKDSTIQRSSIDISNQFLKLADCDVVIVCVPTPVDEEYRPDLKPVVDAVTDISANLKDGSLVVIESTIFPGVCEEIVKPILDKSNKKYYLAHCPERVDPGNKTWNVSNLPRVIGGLTEEDTQKAYNFYKTVINADITILSSIKSAEAVKMMENSFRDVNIAFINEMAKSFDRLGIDTLEVIKGASTKPFSFMPHYPSCGVGGHCIPVDPYYLISRAEKNGFHHDFLSLARRINNSMPEYTVELFIEELNKIEKPIKKAKVGILGLAYKKNIEDIRESPSLKIYSILKSKKAIVSKYDPYIESDYKDLDSCLKNVDYIIIATDHDEFTAMDLNKLKENNIKIVIDGKNCLDNRKVKELGIAYKGIGR